jgi:hypothetical protein
MGRRTLADEFRSQANKPSRNGTVPPFRGDSHGESISWEPPVALTPTAALPAFPLETLPGWLARWVAAEAEALQVPQDVPGMLVLGIAGAAIAGKYRVSPRPGWEEPCNIFVVCSLPPGERKSAVFADATAPVNKYEAELIRECGPRIAELETEHRQLEAKLKHIENKIAREDDPEEAYRLKQQAKELARELAEHVVPDLPQLVCDDVTPEKLSNLLERQGGRILQASAEGTAFEIAKGRYSETANFDVYLKAHAGDQLRTGRMSRDAEFVEQPALSCALAVQPDVIRGLAESATMRGRGFLGRWLYSIPTSNVGSRKVRPAPVPTDVADAFRTYMLSLWRLPQPQGPDGRPAPILLTFAPGADRALQEFETWLEPQLAEGEDLSYLAGWANKLAGAAVRIAGILHMAGAVTSSPMWPPVVGEDAARQAIVLARGYLVPHARAAFGLMGADERLDDASRVVAWLPRGISLNSLNNLNGVAPFTVSTSEVHVGVFGGRRKVEEVEGVMELLVKLHYLRAESGRQPRQGPGRKPSTRYEVHPAVLATAQK